MLLPDWFLHFYRGGIGKKRLGGHAPTPNSKIVPSSAKHNQKYLRQSKTKDDNQTLRPETIALRFLFLCFSEKSLNE